MVAQTPMVFGVILQVVDIMVVHSLVMTGTEMITVVTRQVVVEADSPSSRKEQLHL